MAIYQNVWFGIGYAGNDPETHHFPEGGMVTNVSLATTRYWKKKGSEDWSEETTWHRLVFYGRDAEKVAAEIKKGSRMSIQGYIRSRTVGEGESKKYYTDLVVDRWINLDPKEKKEYDSDGYQGYSRGEPEPESAATTDPLAPISEIDDDLPF